MEGYFMTNPVMAGMGPVQTAAEEVRLQAQNVGGIDETEVEFRPGVNVLTGWNASNRTSLLQAIMAAVGSDRVSLKGDAQAGRVKMTMGEETYVRSIERRGDDVAFGGDPFTEDPELADLFAFLLESNDARRAVARGDDLREIIMRPIDTEAIQAEIEELEARQREIESKLQERSRIAEEMTSLEEERDGLEAKIAEKRAALEQTREEIGTLDAEIEETRERKAELESKLTELQEKRSTLGDVRFRIETERESVKEIEDELAEIEAELESHDGSATDDIQTLREQIEHLRSRKRAFDSTINQLQALIQFNEEVLNDESPDVFSVLDGGSETNDEVTDQLLPEAESLVCWTCGQETTREDIEKRLDTLRGRRTDLVEQRRETTEDLERKKDRREEIIQVQEHRDELEDRQEKLERELQDADEELDRLQERRAELIESIERIEAEVEDLREDAYDEIIDVHKEANTLELEVEQLESELQDTEERLQSTQQQVDELASLEDEQSEVRTRLEEARSRIQNLEDEAIAAFNDHMAAILDFLEYDNLERIWLERVEREVREGRQKVSREFFELHIVRSTETGTVYEDRVAHLSESEREVTGLVFALAGYLAHEVYEEIPFMLLDSIEAIDSNRIASLVEYLEEHAEYLVVALLPEDAAAVDDSYHRISEI